MRTTIVSLLSLLILNGSLCADELGPTTKQVRQAIDKALPLLAKGATGHIDNRSCFACHNQAVPMLAFTTAERHGYHLVGVDLDHQRDHVLSFISDNRERFLQGKGTGGRIDTAGSILWLLAQAGHVPDDSTAAVASYLLQTNKDLDHWRANSSRPPTQGSAFTATYLALRGLHRFGRKEDGDTIRKRQEKALAWALKTKPKDTEDRVFRLWLLKECQADRPALEEAASTLLQSQRKDSGWSQLDERDSDAYATGSALVALHEAGGIPADDSRYRAGLRFLLANQHDDGSWLVHTRSKPIQPYFESGFPHGKDQFISVAATAWATTALALASPMPTN